MEVQSLVELIGYRHPMNSVSIESLYVWHFIVKENDLYLN